MQTIVLIGGGDLLLACARIVRSHGFSSHVVLAPRHAEETLPLDGRRTDHALAAEGIPFSVVESMVADSSWRARIGEPARAMALCLGPAWIFPAAVRETFGLGMVNFNGIPIPHYLGGAHYTWQIMNGDRSGGCFIQEITARIDRGDILRSERFQLPESVRIPQHFFEANTRYACGFLERFVNDLRGGAQFAPVPFSDLDSERLYFPRLMTRENGIIDWSWSAADIVRFCNAFDQPYPGAGTQLDGAIVRLRDVSLAPGGTTFHPYAAGLVVRIHQGVPFMAATGGLVRVGTVVDDNGADVIAKLKEGMRLVSPPDRLVHARTYSPSFGSHGAARKTVS